MEAPAIGIDLGTTNSCVGVFQFGKVEIIPNDQGKKTTPSYVAFTKHERLVGDLAKEQGVRNFKNTIFNVKRLLGRKFIDDAVQADMKQWAFEVINDETKPKIQVEIDTEAKTYCPEEISSMVLTKMKKNAESYLGKPVRKAVITAPIYFNSSQKQAIKDAARIAGLEVLRIMHESSAAAIAYGFEKYNSKERKTLIFDLGGGNFNVSIVFLENGMFEVKSITGDTHLGGEDFDYRMVNHCVAEFKRLHNKDISCDKKALLRLKTACEQAKKSLSILTAAMIEIDALYEGIDFKTSISRTCFEELNADLFGRTLELVKNSIRDANMRANEIDDVVLCGGSSRIPKIQSLLRDLFRGKELNKSINPDEAVAYGAAVQAAMLNCNEKSDKMNKFLMLDVTPLSLGVSINGESTAVVVKRNTVVPIKLTESFNTFISRFDNRTVLDFKFLEAIEENKYKNFLGEFKLSGPSAPSALVKDQKIRVEVTFDIGCEGIFTVSAKEVKTGIMNKMTISRDRNGLSENEIRNMIKEAKEYEVKEEKRRNMLVAKNSLESYCVMVKNTIEDMYLKKCDDTIRWLSSEEAEEEVYALKRKQLENIFNPILNRVEDVEEVNKKKRRLE